MVSTSGLALVSSWRHRSIAAVHARRARPRCSEGCRAALRGTARPRRRLVTAAAGTAADLPIVSASGLPHHSREEERESGGGSQWRPLTPSLRRTVRSRRPALRGYIDAAPANRSIAPALRRQTLCNRGPNDVAGDSRPIVLMTAHAAQLPFGEVNGPRASTGQTLRQRAHRSRATARAERARRGFWVASRRYRSGSKGRRVSLECRWVQVDAG